jgi:hypothetical protein
VRTARSPLRNGRDAGTKPTEAPSFRKFLSQLSGRGEGVEERPVGPVSGKLVEVSTWLIVEAKMLELLPSKSSSAGQPTARGQRKPAATGHLRPNMAGRLAMP